MYRVFILLLVAGAMLAGVACSDMAYNPNAKVTETEAPPDQPKKENPKDDPTTELRDDWR